MWRFLVYSFVAGGSLTCAQPLRWEAQYTQIYSQPPAATSALGPGLQLDGAASVTTNANLQLARDQATIRLTGHARIVSVPAALPLSSNTNYIIEFEYRILNYGTSDLVLAGSFAPPGDDILQHFIPAGAIVKGASVSGSFSLGAMTGSAPIYALQLYAASPDSDVLLSNIKILRQDSATNPSPPASWSSLERLPYPRLGKYFQGGVDWSSRPGMAPFQYSADQIELRLASYDLLAGIWFSEQTAGPAAIRRLRQLNPNTIILPYQMSGEQRTVPPSPYGDASLDYSFFRSLARDWYVKDSGGRTIGEVGDPDLQFLNIYPSSPAVAGQTFGNFLLSWLQQMVFPSGVWDGVFLDNFFAEANVHIPSLSDPANLDFDANSNHLRDETAAGIGEMTRTAVTTMLERFRAKNEDRQLVMGNAGALPALSLAPYLNGSLFECVTGQWSSPITKAAWRTVFDSYRTMQALSPHPRIQLLEACGSEARFNDDSYLAATSDDLRNHRLTLGTTLLSDGFYSFDLRGGFTVPLWYDEYSVDQQGNAVEDRTKKGYLGAALNDGVELTDGGSLIFRANFDAAIPAAIQASPQSAVSVSNAAVILENSDHTSTTSVGINTVPSAVVLSPGSTYLATFDVTVLDTLDRNLSFRVFDRSTLDGFRVPWTVKGDTGTVNFPFTLTASGAWSVGLTMTGGGKVAISNFRILRGGVGAWRRDFENGFVLVNPLPDPRTFSSDEISGVLHRTGVHRIKGTQAPEINNGQAVSGSLTIGAFDSIILLADPIHWKRPTIAGVSNAAGGQSGVAAGAFVSIYGSDFTPLTYDDWNKSILNGKLPAQLDGVSVTVGGKPAYVYAVTPGQINVQAPDLKDGLTQVVVTTPGGTSIPFETSVHVFNPAFFPFPGKQPVATHVDFSLAAKNTTFPGLTTVPAKPGEVVILWGTGFGPTNPVVSAGQQPKALAPTTQVPVVVSLGGTQVPVVGSVLSGYAATYQIAIQIPTSTPDGEYPVVGSVNGVSSPSGIFLSVRR
jgi:uncharacterized protein (TIGR03437 family)